MIGSWTKQQQQNWVSGQLDKQYELPDPEPEQWRDKYNKHTNF